MSETSRLQSCAAVSSITAAHQLSAKRHMRLLCNMSQAVTVKTHCHGSDSCTAHVSMGTLRAFPLQQQLYGRSCPFWQCVLSVCACWQIVKDLAVRVLYIKCPAVAVCFPCWRPIIVM